MTSLALAALPVGQPLPPQAPMRMYDRLPSPLSQPLKTSFSEGAEGRQVLAAEEKLSQLSMLPAGAADGSFETDSSEAIKALQKAAGLPVDGQVGSDTWRALRRQKPLEARWQSTARHAEVWLDKQLLLLVEGGEVEHVVQVSTGQAGMSTPTGTWAVYLQDPDAVSTKYGNAPMPFASYYDGGYAIHQSDSVPDYPASHGCTRVPASFSEMVYEWLKVGDPVRVL